MLALLGIPIYGARMNPDTDPDWLRMQLGADAAIAIEQLLRFGSEACDDYLRSVGYADRLAHLQQLQAAL